MRKETKGTFKVSKGTVVKGDCFTTVTDPWSSVFRQTSGSSSPLNDDEDEQQTN